MAASRVETLATRLSTGMREVARKVLFDHPHRSQISRSEVSNDPSMSQSCGKTQHVDEPFRISAAYSSREPVMIELD
jgi:hypothetical protein